MPGRGKKCSRKFISHGGVTFIGGDVVLSVRGSRFYCHDMKKKASENLGEVDFDTKAGIVGYVNSLVEL
ncbi:hypothetical protein V6N13_086103 [Hibiscus sabdariffa]|uniref:Uncharacterized protein n=1 Tax=Hibiscus sabdariffa TaxID=183260 RepID=A0ABR2FSY3_9ROSI